jgi:hypothetical protein
MQSDSEVWTWGRALGEHSWRTALIRSVSRLLNKAGFKNQWGQGDFDPVLHTDPWQLPSDP